MDIEEGYPVTVPLVYYFGHTTPSDHPEPYKVGGGRGEGGVWEGCAVFVGQKGWEGATRVVATLYVSSQQAQAGPGGLSGANLVLWGVG